MARRRLAWLMMALLDSRLMKFNGLESFDEVFDLSINESRSCLPCPRNHTGT
jgi:hypothetical protein